MPSGYEIFRLTYRFSIERTGNINHVDNDGLDAIALALDLGDYCRHLVSVESIIDLAVNVVRLKIYINADLEG